MSREIHFWIVAPHASSQLLIYGGTTEDEAFQKGSSELSIPFKIREFPTRDPARASSMLKGNTLQATHDLEFSLRPLRHKVRRSHGRSGS